MISDLGWALHALTGALIRRDTDRRSYVRTEQRQVTATSQSHPGPPGAGGGRKRPPLEPLQGAGPCDNWISAQ